MKYLCVQTFPTGATVRVVGSSGGPESHGGEVLPLDERLQQHPDGMGWVYVEVTLPGFELPARRAPVSPQEGMVRESDRYPTGSVGGLVWRVVLRQGRPCLAVEYAHLPESAELARAHPLILRMLPSVPVLGWLWWTIVRFPVLWGLGALMAWVLGRRLRKQEQAQEEQFLAREQNVQQTLVGSARESGPGQEVGGYRLIRELGRGGMGIVYLAESQRAGTPQQVAIKWMKSPAAASDVDVRRFAREGRVGEALTHPGIVGVHAQGEEAGRLFLVMDYVDGESLEVFLDPEGLPCPLVAEILGEIVPALQHAHDQGIVHRDLKPSNILCTRDGHYKLTDFGLARRHDFSALTMSDTALGTPAYMPPEQIVGQVATAAADQYALGITVYELLCGRAPFEGSNLSLLLRQHVYEAPPAPSTLRADLPPGLDPVLLKMLAKAPGDRYPTVQAAGEALLATLQFRERP